MTTAPRNAAVFGVAAALLAVAVAGATASVGAAGPVAAAAQANATDQGHHVDPAEVEGEGDLARVRGWLSDRLTDRLDQQSLHLAQGEFAAAEDALDDEYRRRLAQYVDVAGEGDGSAAGQAYEQAGANQRALVTVVQEYETTYDEYRAARNRGDARAANRTARRLQSLANRVERRAGNASSGLRTVEDRAGVETDPARERIDAVRENVTARQAQVRQATFVETTIVAETNAEAAAFDRPATISGRVRTERGEPLANKRVIVDVGQRRYEPETDGEGRFTVTYRPVGVAADATSISVAYRPGDETPYLASSTSVALSIGQVQADVTTSVDPATARLGTDLRIAASATVGDQVVPSLPIRFTAAERDLGTDRTGSGGVANANWTVPADVAPGDHVVRVTVGPENAAVQAAETTRSVAIEETPTQLSVEATQEGDAVAVDGRLALADAAAGASLPAELPVTVSVGGETETVRTGPEGDFAASVPLSSVPADAESVTVEAAFDGEDTNLEAATFERTVPLSTGGGGGFAESLGTGPLAAIVGGGLLVGLLVVVLLVRWLRGRRAGSGDAADRRDGVGMAGRGDRVPVPGQAAPDAPEDVHQRLANARGAMADGAIERAVASAYAAAHGDVTDRLALDGVLTPRELVAAADGRLDPATLSALEELTAVYEQVVFASEATEDAGEQAIEAATAVVEASGGEVPAAEAGDD